MNAVEVSLGLWFGGKEMIILILYYNIKGKQLWGMLYHRHSIQAWLVVSLIFKKK